MSWDDKFSDLEEFYPGSSKKINREPPDSSSSSKPDSDLPEWLRKPWSYSVEGQAYEFFTIGHLAKALNRPHVTIRWWEEHGIIPVPFLKSPSEFKKKRRRLYTRPQIEGMRQIAEEEGLLASVRPNVTDTRFRERVLELFAQLARTPVYGAHPYEDPKGRAA